jgi:hypothetical protein
MENNFMQLIDQQEKFFNSIFLIYALLCVCMGFCAVSIGVFFLRSKVRIELSRDELSQLDPFQSQIPESRQQDAALKYEDQKRQPHAEAKPISLKKFAGL